MKITWHKLNSSKVKPLQEMELPDKWKVKRVELSFERHISLGKWSAVKYDKIDDIFYIKGSVSSIYPGDKELLREAIRVMDQANLILKGD